MDLIKLSLAGEVGAISEGEVDTEDGEAEAADGKGPVSLVPVGAGVAKVAGTAGVAAVVGCGMSWAPLAGPWDELGTATRPGPGPASVLIDTMAAAFSGGLGVLDMRKPSGEDCECERMIRKGFAEKKRYVRIQAWARICTKWTNCVVARLISRQMSQVGTTSRYCTIAC